MTFEVYQKGTEGPREKPFVTIAKNGTLHPSAAAKKLLGEAGQSPSGGGMARVRLLYDRSRHLMALAPVDENAPNSYSQIKVGKRGGAKRISGVGFCRYYGIKHERTRRYPAEMSDGMLVVDLNNGFDGSRENGAR